MKSILVTMYRMTSATFFLNLQSKDVVDSVMLWKCISYGGSVFALIFFSCEIGQQFTNSFERVSDRFDLLKWYLFPNKIQQLLPTILINTQEPIIIECYGLMNGSRDQFKKVNDFGCLIESLDTGLIMNYHLPLGG